MFPQIPSHDNKPIRQSKSTMANANKFTAQRLNPNEHPHPNKDFAFSPVTPDTVAKLLKSMNPNKAMPNGISARLSILAGPVIS